MSQRHRLYLDGILCEINFQDGVYTFEDHPFGNKGLEAVDKVEGLIDGCLVSFDSKSDKFSVTVNTNVSGSTFPQLKTVCEKVLTNYKQKGWNMFPEQTTAN